VADFSMLFAFGAPWRKGGSQAVFRHYLFGRTRFPEIVENTAEHNAFGKKHRAACRP
jgi:hypothetical protein